MPTYEYQCTECGSVFDVFQSIKAAPLKKADCESCGAKRPVKRLIGTGGAVIFKGSGFYQTDYRSESYKSAAKSDGGAADSTGAAAADSSTAAKSETKSDAKPGKSSAGSKTASSSKSSSKSKD